MQTGLRENARHIRIPRHDGAGADSGGYLALPPQGSGPGLIIVDSPREGQNALYALCERLAEEGYVVLGTSTAASGMAPAPWLTAIIDALREQPQQVGGI